MKKFILCVLVLILIADTSSAQRRYHRKKMQGVQSLTFGLGATNFLGELGGANLIGSKKISIRDFDFPSIRPDISIGYHYQFHRNWAAKGELNAGFIGGNDHLTKELFRNNRNLNFRSPVIELSGRMEFLYPFKRKGQQYKLHIKGWSNIDLTSFFYVGVAGFYFDPRAKLNGNWYRLKPLCTEGQTLLPTRSKYSNFQIAIPMGLGIRYAINKKWSLCLEYGTRWTFTDYIDDVSLTYVDNEALREAKGDLAVTLSNPSPTASDPTNPLYNSTVAGQQRGDPRDKDSYMFLSLSVQYKLGRGFIPKLRF